MPAVGRILTSPEEAAVARLDTRKLSFSADIRRSAMATKEPTPSLSSPTVSERRLPYERPTITKGRPVEAVTLFGQGGSKGVGPDGGGPPGQTGGGPPGGGN
jgi:hypothetical protein